MKTKFLDELKGYLEEKNIKQEDIEEILQDYKEFYEGYEEKGLSEKEIIKKLGSVQEVYNNIKYTLRRREIEKSWQKKLLSATPILSTIIFVLIGSLTKVWHPTWLVFLMVPIMGILFNGKKISHKIIGVMPFIVLASFILIIEYTKVWYPTVLIFILIPVVAIMFSRKDIQTKIIGVTPFIATIFFILIGHYTKTWHPTWLVFLAIPLVGILIPKKSSQHK